MVPNFAKAEKAVHYPTDRRAYLGLSKKTKIILFILIVGILGTAWFQYLVFGLPADSSAALQIARVGEPSGFPVWVSLAHWVNFFFFMLIIRSGLSILFDHPLLYWDNSCNPKKQWLAKVGYERTQEIQDPEMGLERARENWQKLGRSEKWIQQRMTGQDTCNKLTDYW